MLCGLQVAGACLGRVSCWPGLLGAYPLTRSVTGDLCPALDLEVVLGTVAGLLVAACPLPGKPPCKMGVHSAHPVTSLWPQS